MRILESVGFNDSFNSTQYDCFMLLRASSFLLEQLLVLSFCKKPLWLPESNQLEKNLLFIFDFWGDCISSELSNRFLAFSCIIASLNKI